MNETQMVDYMISELRKLHGELILQKTMFESRERLDFSNLKDIDDLLETVAAEKKKHDDLMKLMEYNRGKMDAYVDIMNLLGHKFQ
jgi:hypothetical protein